MDVSYRAVLDWPDSPGWWWQLYVAPECERLVKLVYAEHELEVGTPIVIDDVDYLQERQQDRERRSLPGRYMFTKLQEKNPFGPHQ